MEEKKLTKLKGCVDSIVYKNEDTGFVVLVLDVDDEPVNVAGEIGDVDEGEELTLYGAYGNHFRYGHQFKASLCERTLPKKASAIQKYLASGVIKGLGPVLAKEIITKFGENTFEIFEKEPERLTEVGGISSAKAKRFASDFASKFAVRRLMSYLAENEIEASVGVRAYKVWGELAIDMVKSNPYCLCSTGVGLPFSKADQMAERLEMAHDSEYRVTAGIVNVLHANANEGHTCLPIDKLRECSCAFLGVSPERFDEVLDIMHEDHITASYTKSNGRVYEMLADYALADMNISRRINVMKQLSYDTQIDYSDVIDIAEEQNGITYEATQRKAINTALSVGFLVLTGGPGTGKTTTLNAIISLFEQQSMNVMIAAPTGRAAKRIADLTGYEAKTIHRLLEVQNVDGDRPCFAYNEDNTLDCDVMIIDEMSMVDTMLFSSLLKALPLNCKLIMVGDSDQLPSVGAGNLLKDIIDSGVVPTVKLNEVFRQAQSSRIVVNAHRIINGQELLRGDCDDFFFFSRTEYDGLQSLVVDLCKDRLPSKYSINPQSNIQVISPTRQGPCGTIELNRILQQSLNPPMQSKKEIKTFMYTFRTGDKVMQNRNNYDITWRKDTDAGTEQGAGIFNGDIGVITDINKVLGIIKIDFDGRICSYTVPMLDNVELAYAITVHKSQGSEFDYVILASANGYDKLCYRNLLYTAVTRAKKMLIIVGSMNVVNHMIANNRRTNRYTCLMEMLREDNSDVLDI